MRKSLQPFVSDLPRQAEGKTLTDLKRRKCPHFLSRVLIGGGERKISGGLKRVYFIKWPLELDLNSGAGRTWSNKCQVRF